MFKIDHIGIAVNSLLASVPAFEAVLGVNPAGQESVPEEDVEVVFFGHGPGRIELLQPVSPDSPVARFLEKRGQGLHHVCLSVPHLDEALTRLAGSDIHPIAPGVRTGAGGRPVAFLHPRDCGGVLLELVEAVD